VDSIYQVQNVKHVQYQQLKLVIRYVYLLDIIHQVKLVSNVLLIKKMLVMLVV